MSRGIAQPHDLVVNDDPHVFALFRDMLGDEGFQVSTQSFVVKDLDGVERPKPDCVVPDCP